jgi:hypothetical protein
MPNKWTTFVKEWAAKNNLSYGCAMTKPECKDEYRKANPKPIKTPKKRQAKAKAKDVSYESLEEAMPTEAKKPINLKIKELPKKPKISAAQKVFETPDLIREIASYKETITDEDVKKIIRDMKEMRFYENLMDLFHIDREYITFGRGEDAQNNLYLYSGLQKHFKKQQTLMESIIKQRLNFLITKNKLPEISTFNLDESLPFSWFNATNIKNFIGVTDNRIGNETREKVKQLEILLLKKYIKIMKLMGIREENSIKLLKRKLPKSFKLSSLSSLEETKSIKSKTKEPSQKLKVKRITIDGTEYFIDKDNNLFDAKTYEEIGIYDKVNKKIMPLSEDDEDEDEDEDEIKGGMIDKVWYSPTAMKEYATAIVKGRNDYQPKAREIIKKFGDRKILKIYACRNPVQKLLTAALNAVSFGQFNKNWETQPYDDLFHLSLRVELDTQPQVSVAIEKTDAVTLTANPAPKPKTTECEFIPLNKEITLNQLLQGGETFMGNKYFTYSAKDNNCQDYVMGLLRGSNIGTQENYDFIKQNTKELFKNLPGTRKISNTITDIGAVANVVIQGAGKKQKRKKDL